MAGGLNLFAISVFFWILNATSGADNFHFTRIGGKDAKGGRKTVLDGERRVILECAVSDSRQIGFRWTLSGISVDNSSRRHQIGSDLYFSRIDREEDAGDFSCVATHFGSGQSKTSAPISLNVLWISPLASVQLQSPDRASEIRRGTDVILKCKVEATTSDLEYGWYRNGDPVERSERVVIRGKKLHIYSATPEENGCYKCTARHDFAGVAERWGKFPLIVHDEKTPKILVVPEDLVVKRGQNARFDCLFEADTLVQWFYLNQNRPLSNSSRYITHPNGSLTIVGATEDEKGLYKCLGYSQLFPEQEPQIYSANLITAFLEDLSVPSSFDPPPLLPSNKLAVPEKSEAEIYCELPLGLPTPRLWWEGPDGKVILSETSAFSQTQNTLLLRNLKAGNYSYTCVAENIAGVTRAELDVVVTPAPTIFGHPLSTMATEGETIFLMCQFRGAAFPLSQIHWMKNGEPIVVSKNAGPSNPTPIALAVADQFPQRLTSFPENGTLKIESVEMTDQGNYTCEIITQGHPSVVSRPAQLFVTETLKFLPKPIDRKLELGSNAKLHCRAHGVNVKVKWVKEGQTIFHWPDHITDQNGTLHFTNVQTSDNGRYTCVATNDLGIINATINVDVIVSPKFSVLPKNPTEATEGRSIMINCQAYGDPMPTIQWDKNNVMNGFDSNRFIVMENGSLLVVEVLKEDDGMKLGCTAGNSGGFRREEVRLIVKSNDRYFSESLDETVMTRTISITLSVAAGYMLLVVGLMMWCRYRQLQRKQAYMAEIRLETGDAEMKDNINTTGSTICNGNGTTPLLIPNGQCQFTKAESCRESVKSDGETAKSSHSSTIGGTKTASITSHRSALSQNSKRSAGSGLDKISFPRQDLQFVMLLGHGDFGEVFLAKGKSFREDGTELDGESLVMVKALQTREETALLEYKREIDMYHKLCHENVAKLVRLCREMDPHYMIMEYSDWGDLKQFLLATRKDCSRQLPIPKPPPLTVSQILQVISQVALGMEHLSNHRFIHKDLATRNCLISSGLRIKVANPCLSKDTYSTEYHAYKNQVLPIRWIPSEALEDDFSTKSDIWSFAVLVWEVIHQAAMPLSNLSNEQVSSLLERKELRWNASSMDNNKMPSGVHKMLAQCWEPSPRNRSTFSTIVIQLSEIIKDELNVSNGNGVIK